MTPPIPDPILVVLRLADPAALGQLFDQICWETENRGKKMIEGDGKGFRRGGRRVVQGRPPMPAPQWHEQLQGLSFDTLYAILDAIEITTGSSGGTTPKVKKDVFKRD